MPSDGTSTNDKQMISAFGKSLVLWGIAKGLRLPQPHLDRIAELTLLKSLLQQLEIGCVLDVGANRGQFAGELRAIGYSGFILSFEPLRTEFLAMQARFKDDARWQGYQLALGRANESKIISVPRLTVMSSFLEPLHGQADSTRETVEVRRLDELLSSMAPRPELSRLFLKMDTQGYDLEVFRGATGLLDRIQGIQSELSVQPLYRGMPHYLEALGVYETAGFDLFNLSVVNRIRTGGLLEMNCFMRRASPLER